MADSARPKLYIGLVLRQSLKILRARAGIWLLAGLFGTALNLSLIVFVFDQILQIPILAAIQTIIVYAAFQTWTGQPFRPDALLQGRRLLPVFGIWALTFLAAIPGFPVVTLALNRIIIEPLFVLRGIRVGEDSVGGYIAFSLSLQLSYVMVAAAVIVTTCAAVPACVVDGLGPIASLRRCFRPARGSFWKIFAGFLTVLLAAVVFVVVWFEACWPRTNFGFYFPTGIQYEASFLVLKWFFFVFFNILATTIYANLRMNSESLTTEKIAGISA